LNSQLVAERQIIKNRNGNEVEGVQYRFYVKESYLLKYSTS